MLPLQSFDFRKSPYERPNLKWVCGRLAEGAPCHAGPDRHGRCRAGGECAPRRHGSRWTCTRPPSAGGPCDDGPRPDGSCGRPVSPCQPVRSLRAKRGLAARWTATLAVGVAVLILHGSAAPRWLSPGETTVHHADIDSCGTCHGVFEGGPAYWVHAAFSGVPAANEGDSGRCMACHAIGEHPFNPHGAPEERLAQSARARPATGREPIGVSLASRLLVEPDATGDGIACATCHREHQGRGFEMTAMSDARCQSCHMVKFAAFSEGHPPFNNYPYSRRTRINFDHVSHLRLHFPKADADIAPARCRDCHGTDDAGRLMLVQAFEASCGACHAGEIRGESAAGSAGIAVLAVPGLDLVSLRERGAAIGAWPELSDREMTPFMKAILAADPDLRPALKRFEALDPLDLRGAETEDLAAVETVAWAVKELLHGLVADGPATLGVPLSQALGRQLTPEQASGLVAGLPLDSVDAARQAWFPDLAQEVARYRAGEPVPIPSSEFDMPLTESVKAGTADGEADGSGEEILSADEDAASGDLLAVEPGGDAILSGDEDLGGGLLGNDGNPSEASAGAGDLLAGDTAGAEETDAAVAEAAVLEPVPEDWSRLGGWYYDGFALLYRPVGHADGFLRWWLELAGAAAAGDDAKDIFETLAGQNAPGRCVKCHSVDRSANGAFEVNWWGHRPNPQNQELTRFRHAPHLALLQGDRGCATCHVIADDADYLGSYVDRDPLTYESNFRSIAIDACSDCHIEQEAGDACQLCHSYHVGPIMTEVPDTLMGREAAGRD